MSIWRPEDAMTTENARADEEELDAPRVRDIVQPQEPRVILGRALEARANDIARMVLDTWEAGKSESYTEDDRVRQDVLRFVVSGSAQVTHFLVTGERPTAEQVRSQSTPG